MERVLDYHVYVKHESLGGSEGNEAYINNVQHIILIVMKIFEVVLFVYYNVIMYVHSMCKLVLM